LFFGSPSATFIGVSRKFAFVFLASVAVGVFFWKGSAQRWAAPVSPPPKVVSKTLGDIGRLAPTIGPLEHPAQASGAPSECDTAWKAVLDTDFNGWLEALSQGRAQADPQCRAWEKQHWSKTFGKFPADSCFDAETVRTFVESRNASKEEVQNLALTTCLPMLTFYRSWAINLATRSVAYKNLPAPVLANKIFARFVDFHEPGAKQDILEWNARLKELEPDLYATYKIPLLMHAIDDTPAPEELADFLRTTERFEKNDPEVQELQLVEMLKQKGDLQAFEQALDEFSQHTPQEARWDYYRGYLAWKRGDAVGATSHVNEALQKTPGNIDYKKTLEQIKQHPPGEKGVFSFSLNVRFDQL
jgi:hypothetical protein